MRVVYRLGAGRDVGETRRWYETQRSGKGLEFQKAIEALERLISTHPEGCPVVHGKVRRALVTPFTYAVYYQPLGAEALESPRLSPYPPSSGHVASQA